MDLTPHMTLKESPERVSNVRSGALTFLLAVAIIGALSCFAIIHAIRERHALTQLPGNERSALYQRTLDNLTTVCAAPNASVLQSFCADQAALIVKFPECDSRCQHVAAPFIPKATK